MFSAAILCQHVQAYLPHAYAADHSTYTAGYITKGNEDVESKSLISDANTTTSGHNTYCGPVDKCALGGCD